MSDFINNHPSGNHPFNVSLVSNDNYTLSGVNHRQLTEKLSGNVLLDYMETALQKHHIDMAALERRKELIKSLKIQNATLPHSPYPQSAKTQRGNFAEVFLAEYLEETTSSHMPVYRLRYNPNVDQSMKGDDVLLFDLDSDPVRIIVGEAKFRGIPSKRAVVDAVEGLIRSNQLGLPISLQFVADRLFEYGDIQQAKKVQNCVLLFANNKIEIDYVGLLMSNNKAADYINKYTSNTLHNLLMVSLEMNGPEAIVEQTFLRLEAKL